MIIVKPSGKGLTQKEEPKLCLIHPQIELDKATLTLTASGCLVLLITKDDVMIGYHYRSFTSGPIHH